MLLRLCGAKAKNFDDIHCEDDLQNKDHLVLMRNKPSSRDLFRIRKLNCNSDIPVVSMEWLEDSITEFNVRSYEPYSNFSP